MVLIHSFVAAMVMPYTYINGQTVSFVSLMKHSVTRLPCATANLFLELISLLQIFNETILEMQGYLMLVLAS